MTDKSHVGSGMTTRIRSRQSTTDQHCKSVTEDSGIVEWFFPNTKQIGRDMVTERVEAYFNKCNSLPNHNQLKAEWARLKGKISTPYHPSLLDFIINKMKSETAQYTPNYKTSAQLKKAKFLLPFNIESETK